MDAWWVIAFCVAASAVLAVLTWPRSSGAPAQEHTPPRLLPALEAELRRAWRNAADKARLVESEEPPAPGEAPWVHCHLDDLRVRIDRLPGAAGPLSSRIDLRWADHGFQGLSILPRACFTAANKSRRTAGLEVGDETFDQQFWVDGPPALVMSLLDETTRRQIAALFQGSLPVVGRVAAKTSASLVARSLEVGLEMPGIATFRELNKLSHQVLDRALELSRRLKAPDDLAARLARNLEGEPVGQVRLRTLRALISDCWTHPATRRACRALLLDPLETVRLEAALALRQEGWSTLKLLLADAATSPPVAERALGGLAEALPAAEVAEVLLRALGSGRERLALRCVAILGQWGLRGEWTPAVELTLTRTLEVEGQELAQAAARALGNRGTAAAVPALREAEERGPRELARAARQAIAEIQARLEGAEAGQLSLSASEAGELSLVRDNEAGRVTVVEESRLEPVEPARQQQLEKG